LTPDNDGDGVIFQNSMIEKIYFFQEIILCFTADILHDPNMTFSAARDMMIV
jgi:hypothetical protein